jgi:nucleoside-diphosphate-sugar epimerase
MNILVIGGTGFISGRLVRLLVDEGHSISVLTRGTKKVAKSERVEHLQGDRDDAESLRQAVDGRSFDVVYDIIAYSPEQSRIAVDIFKGRTERFIHCSTVSVYMVSHDVRCPVTEDQDRLPPMPYWPQNPFGMDYGLQKRGCEEVLCRAHDAGVLDVTMLRPTYVCGPRDPTVRDWFWIQRLLDRGPILVPGSGDYAFQLVYVDDVARAFVDVLDRPDASGKTYNVAGEDILTLNEYLHRLAALLGREADLIHVDQDIFDTAQFSRHPRGDVFPFNTRRTAVLSLDHIKRDLNFKSTPFETWMKTTIDWYLQEYSGDSLGYDRRDDEVRFAEQWQHAREEMALGLRS